MDCGCSYARMNVEDDRLSMLPDDLIYRILSFIGFKYAIQTSALSSRWRFIWASMPHLNISSDEFRSLQHFSKFVGNVLSNRNDQAEVYSVNLSFRETLNKVLLKKVLDYAFSHNIQQLTVTWTRNENVVCPLHLFCSQSLKYLSLNGRRTSFPDSYSIILGPTWELAALTTLQLNYVVFVDDNSAGIFSKCANLKNLTLSNFAIRKSNKLNVCHPQLFSLTLEDGNIFPMTDIDVVAPQLKNLTIRSCYGKLLITAPNLVSLLFDSSCSLHFSTDLCFLEKVDLCLYSAMLRGSRIASLLQHFHSVKFLTLNLELIEPLSSYIERSSLQPSPFFNLRSLKIYPIYVPSDDAHKKVTMSTEVLNYLLDGSPNAALTIISYEEIMEKQKKTRQFANALKAQNLMSNLQKYLEKERANIETLMDRKKTSVNADTHDQGKTQVENMQLRFERKMTQMKSCWEDFGVQIDQGRSTTYYILAQLRDIEELLLKDLPTSKRDALQECFSGLCAEADDVVEKILHHIKIPQIHLRDCFDERATT